MARRLCERGGEVMTAEKKSAETSTERSKAPIRGHWWPSVAISGHQWASTATHRPVRVQLRTHPVARALPPRRRRLGVSGGCPARSRELRGESCHAVKRRAIRGSSSKAVVASAVGDQGHLGLSAAPSWQAWWGTSNRKRERWPSRGWYPRSGEIGGDQGRSGEIGLRGADWLRSGEIRRDQGRYALEGLMDEIRGDHWR